MLENKGIIPIDLSPMFPKPKYPENIRHKEAIKWFLKELQKGKPPNPMNWPKVSKEHCRSPIFQTSVDHLKKIYEFWNKDRSEYPGWIIAPEINRNNLWDCTVNWINIIFDFTEISDPEKLLLLFELELEVRNNLNATY